MKTTVLTLATLLLVMTSCHKEQIEVNVPCEEFASVSFDIPSTYGTVYAFEQYSTTPSDSCSIGCGDNVQVQLGEFYVFKHKDKSGNYVDIWRDTIAFYNHNNGQSISDVSFGDGTPYVCGTPHPYDYYKKGVSPVLLHTNSINQCSDSEYTMWKW